MWANGRKRKQRQIFTAEEKEVKEQHQPVWAIYDNLTHPLCFGAVDEAEFVLHSTALNPRENKIRLELLRKTTVAIGVYIQTHI